MADAKRDANREATALAVTNDANLTPELLRVDPATFRLLVNATITSGGGGTEYAVGVAAGATDLGTLGLVIRDDALTTLTDVDGDYVALRVGSTGALWTTVTGDVNVTATDLDIRNLTSTDVVTVTGGAGQTADVKITLDSESVAVTGTFWQATQPVSGTFWQATQPISVASLPLPSGAATEATLLTIDTDTGNIVTAVQLIDDAIYTDGTGTPSKGIAVMGTDGTNPQFISVDASGNVQVEVLTMPSTTVTATDLDIRNLTSTDVVTVTGGVGQTADVKITLDSEAVTVTDGLNIEGDVASGSADSGNPVKIGGKYNATMPTFADGQRGDLQISTRGVLKVALFNNDSAVALLGKADNADDVAVTASAVGLQVQSRNTVFDGTTWDRMRGDATDGVLVNLGTNNDVTITSGTITAVTSITNAVTVNAHAVTNAGTFVVQENGAALTALQLIDNIVGVEDAGETAGGGLAMAGSVRRDTPASSAGTTGDNATVNTDAQGRVWVHPVPNHQDLATLATAHVKKYYTNAGAVTDGIIWSPAAGTRWFITDIFINVSAAATVTLEDDLVAGDSAIWKAELAGNSGWSHSFTTPWFSGEDASDLIITTTAGNVYCMVVGYEI